MICSYDAVWRLQSAPWAAAPVVVADDTLWSTLTETPSVACVDSSTVTCSAMLTQSMTRRAQRHHTDGSLAPKRVRLAPNGTNLGLFKISFCAFWLDEPKCTETDLKKSKICPILVQSNTRCVPKRTETDLKNSTKRPIWDQSVPR